MYEKQEWSDVYGETPFNADRMKHIEDGIYKNSLDNVYSTDEVFTGKYWIDGKKIYRKVFVINTTNETVYKIDISNLNYASFITLKSINQGEPIEEDYRMSDADLLRTHISIDKKLNVTLGTSFPIKNSIVYTILEYTKTTD